MTNTTTNIVPKLLAMGMKALRENAVMTRLVNRSFDSIAAQPGNIINVPSPSAITARDVTAAITWATNQDFSPGTVAVTLDFWKEATFQLSDSDYLSIADGYIPMQASEAIKSLANAVDKYILGRFTSVYGHVGTADSEPFNGSLTAAGSLRTVLNQQLAPMDNRYAVIDPLAEQNLLLNANILQSEQAGSTDAIVKGTIGRKLGFDWVMDQNIQTYTPGAAWASGNTAGTAAGAVGAQTLTIFNLTASGQIKLGDLFTLTADGSKYCYVVNANSTISASVVGAVITFDPPLKTTVASGATLVVVSGGEHKVNLGFHRDAFAWASRPLQDITGYGNQMASAVDPISGIALRLEIARQYKQTTFSYDILGGANCVRPALACRILGA